MPIAYYGTELSPNQMETVEGFLICKNVPIARTGMQEYTAEELQLDGDPFRVVQVFRTEEEVFDPAAMASFEGKPVTQTHPPEEVGPENYAAYLKGHVQNVRRDGGILLADLYINDGGLASEIREGLMREVSCGYLCRYEAAGNGYQQKHIRGNHVAVVPKGRAGHEVAIKDAAQEAEKGRKSMNKLANAILTAFGMAAKDAAPEEIPGLVETTATALDAAPAEKAPDAAPAEKAPEAAPAEPTADVMVERASKGDDLGSKLDRLLEMMESILQKNGREEKELHDGDGLEDLIDKLSGEGKDPEAAVTVPADEVSRDACDPATRDAALLLLKRVQPVIAGMKDKAERARVTDALIGAVQSNDSMGKLLAAQRDSAMAHRNQRAGFDQVCAERKAACDARNPHKKKEEA